MEYEKKSSSLGVIILVIIFAIAAFAGGYYISDSNLLGKKEQSEPAKTEEKEEIKVLDTTDPIIDKAVLNIAPELTCDDVLLRFLVEKDSLKVSDITNVQAINLIQGLRAAGTTLEPEHKLQKDEKGNDYLEFTEEEIAKKIQSKLGKDYKFEHKSYTDQGFEYNSETKKYKIVQIPFGCTTGPHAPTLARYAKAIVQGDKLIVTYKILFGSEVPEKPTTDYKAKYYKDINKTIQVPEKDIDYMWEQEHLYLANENSNKNYNAGSTYKFTFKNENDNYVFVSSELVKE